MPRTSSTYRSSKLLTDVNPSSGLDTVIGVIGGYQQGGLTDAVSYADSCGVTYTGPGTSAKPP